MAEQQIYVLLNKQNNREHFIEEQDLAQVCRLFVGGGYSVPDEAVARTIEQKVRSGKTVFNPIYSLRREEITIVH